MVELKIYLERFVHFTENEMNIFLALFSELHLKKSECLAKEGEYSTKLAFLKKGVMRVFYHNMNIKTISQQD